MNFFRTTDTTDTTDTTIWKPGLKNDYGVETIDDLTNNFSVLKKCNGKLECLIYEMFFIKKIWLCLNTKSHSIRAKLFIEFCRFFTYIFFTLENLK